MDEQGVRAQAFNASAFKFKMHPHSYVPRAMARGGVRRRAGAPMVERRRPSLKVRCCTPHRRATTTCSARGRRRAAGAANVMCACTQLARMGAARARERCQGGRADRWRRGWRRGWRRCATAVQRERGKHRVRAHRMDARIERLACCVGRARRAWRSVRWARRRA